MKFHNMNAYVYETSGRVYFCSYNAIVCVVEKQEHTGVPCIKFGYYANWSTTTGKQLTRFLREWYGIDMPAAKRRKMMNNPYKSYYEDGYEFIYTPDADWSQGINGKYTHPATAPYAHRD